jgi:hypothetical protein
MGLQKAACLDPIRAVAAGIVTLLLILASTRAAHFIMVPVGDAHDGISIVLPTIVASSATPTEHNISLVGLSPSSLVLFDV